MKRIILAAAALAALCSAFGVRSVQADPVQDWVYDTANDALDEAPSPDDWGPRHVCLTVDPIDQSWCVYFPFPV